jgi:hypothetical protein
MFVDELVLMRLPLEVNPGQGEHGEIKKHSKLSNFLLVYAEKMQCTLGNHMNSIIYSV